ncbi:MAG: ribonuclease HI [Silvanigrellaceae bacterium]|nr:ribonuclease HI [Silvanigrellaceae bacterium]
MDSVHLYTYGACSGNPGPGGWGCVLLFGTLQRRLSGFEENTTNNRMEIMAVIKGLESMLKPFPVTIYTDSQYVKNAFTQGWLENWQKNNWRTSAGASVKNQDLWREMIFLSRKFALSWEWVRGHSGNKYNEVCDELARNAIKNKSGLDMRI